MGLGGEESSPPRGREQRGSDEIVFPSTTTKPATLPRDKGLPSEVSQWFDYQKATIDSAAGKRRFLVFSQRVEQDKNATTLTYNTVRDRMGFLFVHSKKKKESPIREREGNRARRENHGDDRQTTSRERGGNRNTARHSQATAKASQQRGQARQDGERAAGGRTAQGGHAAGPERQEREDEPRTPPPRQSGAPPRRPPPPAMKGAADGLYGGDAAGDHFCGASRMTAF